MAKRFKQDLEGTVSSRTEQLTRANKNLKRAIKELRSAKDAAEAANTAKSNQSHSQADVHPESEEDKQ